MKMLWAAALVLALSPGPGYAASSEAPGFQEAEPGVRFLGEIIPKPDLVVEVVASMWGKIYLEEGVYEGAKVTKDQPLARTILELPALERLPLNDRTIDIAQYLEIARDKARLALDDYRRAVEISKTSPDFKTEAERRKKIYDNALKELQIVNQQNQRQVGVLKRRDPRTVIIKSPLTGYIDEIYFVPGDINPDGEFRKLFTVVDLSTVWVQANIYEKDLEIFRDAPDALIVTEAYPDQTFRGHFQTVGSEIDPQTRTIPVYYQLPNPGEKLKSGLRVRLSPIPVN
ncbi:efflux RND transporter periplasmic adaptor subunit [Acidobacteria bacterium AH-259-D05]|nr:efflux RND transporter periplasmic adaptor subunit [Acidobacteria bacterium AH-259-D05]